MATDDLIPEGVHAEDGLGELGELVMKLMGVNANRAADITQAVIDELRREAIVLKARLEAITDGIEALLHSQWMPTPAAILDRLYPPGEVVQAYKEGRRIWDPNNLDM